MKKFTLLAIVFAAALACSAKEQPAPNAATSERGIDKLRGVHPRLLLTTAKTTELKNSLDGTHQFLWRRFLEDLPHEVDISTGRAPVGDIRLQGDLAPQLAFAWLMTGEDSLLQIARQHVLRLTDPTSWEAPEDLEYLIGSHFLLGIALAYDWLYPELTDSQRVQIATALGHHAQLQYESIVNGRIWWRNQYYQNHSQSNYCGLAFAAAALYGEDSRAGEWLETSEKFFDKIFEVMPRDGSSVEGYAYAGYGEEYVLKYALMAQELLGKDYSGSQWLRNTTRFMIQGLLPARTPDQWALTFGDAPRRGWSSTVQHLFTLARMYRDPTAQWMGRNQVELYPHGLSFEGWMILAEYDPSVPEADPSQLPTFSYFPVIGQTMMRSAWQDTAATLVGFKCGPFMGRDYSKDAVFDWGTGHRHPDDGSFQLFAHGQFLTIDPGYTGFRLAANHNTMLFKGHGQLGEQAGFGSSEALLFRHSPDIVYTDSTPAYDYAVGEVAKAYPPALGVERFTRHLLLIKPDILLVADQLAVADSGAVYDFPPEDLQTEGGFSHAPNGYVIGAQGTAFTVFKGLPGKYKIEVVYLDNVPEQASYSLEVDGRTIYSWKSHNADRDDNLIEVSPEVELKKGNRVVFRGDSLAEGTRLTKLALLGAGVKNPAFAEWLLHFDPAAALVKTPAGLTVTLGGAALDFQPLVPRGIPLDWAIWKVKNADVEPFTFRQTQRLVLRPRLDHGKATLLNLLHTRRDSDPCLQDVAATVDSGGRLTVTWTSQGARRVLVWDLDARNVNLE